MYLKKQEGWREGNIYLSMNGEVSDRIQMVPNLLCETGRIDGQGMKDERVIGKSE
jgi:hypothetical protein